MSSYGECIVPKMKILFFLKIFPIVTSIVIQKCGATPKNSSYTFFWGESGPYYSHTSLCQRAACIVGCCANQGTLMSRYLLSAGAQVDAVDNEQHSALHWAIVCGELEALDLLHKV